MCRKWSCSKQSCCNRVSSGTIFDYFNQLGRRRRAAWWFWVLCRAVLRKYTDLYCALLCTDGWWSIDVDCKLHSHLTRTWSKEQYISHSLCCRCIISVLRHVHFHHCAWETHQRYNTWSALSFIVPLIAGYYVSHLNWETSCSQRYPFSMSSRNKTATTESRHSNYMYLRNLFLVMLGIIMALWVVAHVSHQSRVHENRLNGWLHSIDTKKHINISNIMNSTPAWTTDASCVYCCWTVSSVGFPKPRSLALTNTWSWTASPACCTQWLAHSHS